ncbi:hypothetical protein NP493_628g01025 [Ridgeia piscesae]|uniref:Uncharacterized protein n=1 Tax=Ridgeia piscesae TaxID=27915 RepID=A0AAD9KU63_RIDPI|nr:hypothetical protein NP493_628g01025 [Ridgeia piscesae]
MQELRYLREFDALPLAKPKEKEGRPGGICSQNAYRHKADRNAKHNRQWTSKPTKLNRANLSTISRRGSFAPETDSALAQWEEKESSTPDEEWAVLQQVVYNTAKTYLGKPDRKHQDWFDPQRPGSTGSYKQKRPSPPESVANQEHQIHHCSIQRCLQTATKTHPGPEVGLVGKEGSGTAKSW